MASVPPPLAQQVLEEFESYLDSSDCRFDLEISPAYLRSQRLERERERSRDRRLQRKIRKACHQKGTCPGCGKPISVLVHTKPGATRIYHDDACRARAYRLRRASDSDVTQ